MMEPDYNRIISNKDQVEVGDYVAYINPFYGDGINNPLWNGKYGKITGFISKIREGGSPLPFKVKWSNGSENYYSARARCLCHIRELPVQLELFNES